MKRYTSLILFLFLALSSFSQSDSTSKKIYFVVKTDLFLPTVGLINGFKEASLTFETCFKQRHSIQLTGLFFDYDNEYIPSHPEYHHNKQNTYQLIPEYKYFIHKKNYSRLYIGIYAKYINHYKLLEDNISGIPYSSYSYVEIIQNSIAGGALVGYQINCNKRIILDFLVGLGYRKAYNTKIIKLVNVGIGELETSYPDARIAINLGFRF